MTQAMTTVTVTISNQLSFETRQLSDAAIIDIKKRFTRKNPQFAKLESMGFRGKNEPREYEFYSIDMRAGMFHVWRGGATRLKQLLAEHGYRVVWRDRRLTLPPTGLTMGSLVLQPEQAPAVESLMHYQQGLLRGNTGSGKTEMLLAAAIASQQPTLVQVWNKSLLEQWVERILKYGILPEKQIGIVQGSKNRLGAITIGMIQTIRNRLPELTPHFGCVLVDECQRTPATTFTGSVQAFPAKFRWGGSADEKRKDGKEFLGYETFGYGEFEQREKSILYYPIAEVAGRGQSLDPTIVVVKSDYIDAEYDANGNHGQMINRLTKDETRNALIAGHLRTQLEAGKQIILFTERVEAAAHWVNLVSSWGFVAGPLIGGTDYKEQTDDTLRMMREQSCQFAATTTYADVGIDIPSLNCAFITCPTAVNIKRMHQQVGRIVRPFEGKEEVEAFYFWDYNMRGSTKAIKNIQRKWGKIRRLQ